jgi:hypothetical protein
MIRRESNLMFGWLDSSLAIISRERPEIFEACDVIVVTVLDSDTRVSETTTAKHIVSEWPQCKLWGKSLIIPGRDLVAVAGSVPLFTGFAEVWCFDKLPLKPKPERVSILPPLNLDEDMLPAIVKEWMFSSACRLGAADGIGLNCVTSDPAIGEVLSTVADDLPE